MATEYKVDFVDDAEFRAKRADYLSWIDFEFHDENLLAGQGPEFYANVLWDGYRHMVVRSSTVENIEYVRTKDAQTEMFCAMENEAEEAEQNRISDYYGGNGPAGCYGPDDPTGF